VERTDTFDGGRREAVVGVVEERDSGLIVGVDRVAANRVAVDLACCFAGDEDAVEGVERDDIAGAGELAADGVIGRLVVDVDATSLVGKGRAPVGGGADVVAQHLCVSGQDDLDSVAASEGATL
jgi:hypothetical protein